MSYAKTNLPTIQAWICILIFFLLSGELHGQLFDCNFGANGKKEHGNNKSLTGLCLGNGKVYVAFNDGGNFRYYEFDDADGSFVRSSTSVNPSGEGHSPQHIAFGNGGVIISGTSNYPDAGGGKRKATFVKFNANGSKAWEKNHQYGITHTDHAHMTTDPNGKILICGEIIGRSGNHSDKLSLIARLYTDGVSERAHKPNYFVNKNGYPGPEEGYDRIGSNGKYVYAAGSMDNGSGNLKIRVIKLNDTTFNVDGSFGTSGLQDFELATNQSHYVEELMVQSDNKVVMLIRYGSTLMLVRLNADGSFDSSFSGDGKLNINSLPKTFSGYQTITLQSDDKIVIGGRYNYPTELGSIRLNTDGSFDSGYGVGGINVVRTTGNAGCEDIAYHPGGFLFSLGVRLYLPSHAPNHLLLTLAKFDLKPNGLRCDPPVAKCKAYSANYVNSVITVDPADIDDNSVVPNSTGTLTVTPNTFDCSDIGSRVVTLDVLDPNGKSSSCTANVTINDLEPPTISCPADITVNTNPGSNCGTINYSLPMMTDNCGTYQASVLSGTAPGGCAPVYHNGGINTVTLGGTDASNNPVSCSFTVTVIDVEAPVARCINLTANIDYNYNTSIPYDAIAIPNIEWFDYASYDNSASIGYTGIKSKTLDQTMFHCGEVGDHVVTMTVTDYFDNSSSCTATLSIRDPNNVCAAVQFVEARCKSMQVSLDANAYASIAVSDINDGSITSAGLQSLTVSPHTFSCTEVGVQTVTLTVEDTYSNQKSCTAAVTVNNPFVPTAACQHLTLQLDASGHVSTTAQAIENGSSHICNLSPGLSQTDFDCSHIGPNTVTLTVTGSDGAAASCTATVQIEDHVAPIAMCQSRTVELDATGNASLTAQEVNNNSYDACSNVSLQLSPTTFDCSHLGSNTVSLTVTDTYQNSSSCSANIEIVDLVNPQISCPPNLSLSNDAGICGKMLTYLTPSGTDNCSSNTVKTSGLGSGSVFPLGTTTEAYMVTDAAGNTAACSFAITITDDEKPVISLLGDNPLYLCEGESYVEPGATASDNCDGQVNQNILIHNGSVDTYQEGSYAVTYMLTDANGNPADVVTRTVIVKHTPAQLEPQNCGNCNQIRFDFCEGEAVPGLETLLIANLAYETGASFLWYDDINSQQGAAISTPVLNMNNNNTHFYWVSQLISGCEGPARRMRVRVRKTSIVELDLPALGCNSGQLDLAAWVSDSRGIATGFTFYDNDPTLGTSPVGSVAASNGQVLSGQYAVVSLPTSLMTYYATASNNTGCQVTGIDEVISTSIADLAPVSNLTVNAGDLVTLNLNSTNATHIFWFNLNNAPIGPLGSFGMGDMIFTATNPTGTALTANIRAIAYIDNCAGEVRDFSITVNPGVGSRQGAGNSLQLAASRVNAHDVRVEWEIRYEFALEKIEIEKQINDGEWVTVGQQGVGSHYNVTPQSGSYLDRSGMGNVTKYRLKLVHADGRAIWSDAVEINFEYYDTQRFTLYPNPTNGRFQLRAAGPLEGEWRYRLSDQLGRTILTGKLEGSETAFDISQQPRGYYILVMTHPTAKPYSQKLLKR